MPNINRPILHADDSRDTGAALQFHAATTYRMILDAAGVEQEVMGVPPDVEDTIWQQDWSIQPFPFKIYETPTRCATRLKPGWWGRES
jgi:hypothetical protein